MVISHDKEESLEKNSWKLYFDGASNALKHRIRAVLVILESE